MPLRKINDDTLGFTPEEIIITREKLSADLLRHQKDKQENKDKYLEQDAIWDVRIAKVQARLDFLNQN